MYEVSSQFAIEVAHSLDAAYGNIHGHSYMCEVYIRIDHLTHDGWVINEMELEECMMRVRKVLDHKNLNDFYQIGQPTMENLARHIAVRVHDWFAVRTTPNAPLPGAPYIHKVRIIRPTLGHTATYWPEERLVLGDISIFERTQGMIVKMQREMKDG